MKIKNLEVHVAHPCRWMFTNSQKTHLDVNSFDINIVVSPVA